MYGAIGNMPAGGGFLSPGTVTATSPISYNTYGTLYNNGLHQQQQYWYQYQRDLAICAGLGVFNHQTPVTTAVPKSAASTSKVAEKGVAEFDWLRNRVSEILWYPSTA